MGNFKRFARTRSSGRERTEHSRRDANSFSREDAPKRFSRPSSDRAPRRFERESSDRNERRASLEMFEATCEKCKKRCEVPFRPNGSKPVYCSDCFRKNESFEPRRESSAPVAAPSMDLDQINRKLDRIIRLLEAK